MPCRGTCVCTDPHAKQNNPGIAKQDPQCSERYANQGTVLHLVAVRGLVTLTEQCISGRAHPVICLNLHEHSTNPPKSAPGCGPRGWCGTRLGTGRPPSALAAAGKVRSDRYETDHCCGSMKAAAVAGRCTVYHAQTSTHTVATVPPPAACLQHSARQVLCKVAAPPPARAPGTIHTAAAAACVHGRASRRGCGVAAAAAAALAGRRGRQSHTTPGRACWAAAGGASPAGATAAAAAAAGAAWRRRGRRVAAGWCGTAIASLRKAALSVAIVGVAAGPAGTTVPAPAPAAATARRAASKVRRGRRWTAAVLRAIAMLLALHI